MDLDGSRMQLDVPLPFEWENFSPATGRDQFGRHWCRDLICCAAPPAVAHAILPSSEKETYHNMCGYLTVGIMEGRGDG